MQYASSLKNTSVIQTGLFIDRLVNGIPRGRILEIWGDPSTGKSTAAMQVVAVAQMRGLKCLWVDAEWSYEPQYGSALGIDNKRLGIIRHETAEDIIEATQKEIETGKWDLVVLDSIGALTSRQKFEKASGEKTIGVQASIVADMCVKFVPKLSLTNTALIVINHSFVDIMTGHLKTSGGNKLGYHKSISIRLTVKPKARIEKGGVPLKDDEGKVITATVYKDKVFGNEKKFVDVGLIFHEGFSRQQDYLEVALRKGVITREGNTFYLQGEKLGMISKVRERMKEPEFLEKLKNLL